MSQPAVGSKRPRDDNTKTLITSPSDSKHGPRGFVPSGAEVVSGCHVVTSHQELLEAAACELTGKFDIHDPRVASKQFVRVDPKTASQLEIWRSEEAARCAREMNECCSQNGISVLHLFPAFVFESVFQLSRLQAADPTNANITNQSRTWLHAMVDVGQTVTTSADSKTPIHGKILEITYSAEAKQHLAVVQPAEGAQTSSVPLSQLQAADPIPLYLDNFLPAGEIVPEHRCPSSVQAMSLTMLYEHKRELKAKQKMMAAWSIADRATKIAADARKRFFDRSQTLTPERSLTITVTIKDVGQGKQVDCAPLTHYILNSHFEKLRRMFLDNGHPEEHFPYRLFCLLTRYYSLTVGAESPQQEAGWHCAIPPRAMKVLQQRLGACAESFASPLNAFMRRFCSAFPDTDCFFGSMGSFFTFHPRSGSYEAGPPYDHQVIGEMFSHMCRLFANAEGPLSFVIILPFSERDSAKKVMEEVRTTNYIAYESQLPRNQTFSYVDGYQQCDANRAFIIKCDSRLVVLQNDEAKVKWPVETAMKEFIDAWAAASVAPTTMVGDSTQKNVA